MYYMKKEDTGNFYNLVTHRMLMRGPPIDEDVRVRER
jgi:hypothetical protein